MSPKNFLPAEFLASSHRILDLQRHGEYTAFILRIDGDAKLFISKNHAKPVQVPLDADIGAGVLYGGGELATSDNFLIVAAKNTLIRVDYDSFVVTQITPPFGMVSSPSVSPDGKFVLYLHTDGDIDTLVVVDSDGKNWPQKLCSDYDFYTQPTWHPSGKFIAWVSWNNPSMPWIESKLVVAELSNEAFKSHGVPPRLPHVVKKSELYCKHDVSVQQPEFSVEGDKLAFLSDESGFSHLYVGNFANLSLSSVTQLTTGEVEFSTPVWIEGLRHFQWLPGGKQLLAIANSQGIQRLMKIDLEGSKVDEVAFGSSSINDDGNTLTSLSQISVTKIGEGRAGVSILGSAPLVAPGGYSFDWENDNPLHLKREVGEKPNLDLGNFVEPQHVTWKTKGGVLNCIFYPQSGKKMAAVILIHGGPTAQSIVGWDLTAQFFASRGFVFADLNYRGSTGYGRDYMTALNGKWGVSDIEDVAFTRDYMVEHLNVDPKKVVVLGGSAGGYTVLNALCDCPGDYALGIANYPVSNLISLATNTHKFERYYNDQLIGRLEGSRPLYERLSPIGKAKNVVDPLLIFHGEDDVVIPVDDSRQFIEWVKTVNKDAELVVYPGEGHGWRKEETIRDYYGKVVDCLDCYLDVTVQKK